MGTKFSENGGEDEIRTRAPCYQNSCLAGKRFRPLSHLSNIIQSERKVKFVGKIFEKMLRKINIRTNNRDFLFFNKYNIHDFAY